MHMRKVSVRNFRKSKMSAFLKACAYSSMMQKLCQGKLRPRMFLADSAAVIHALKVAEKIEPADKL